MDSRSTNLAYVIQILQERAALLTQPSNELDAINDAIPVLGEIIAVIDAAAARGEPEPYRRGGEG